MASVLSVTPHPTIARLYIDSGYNAAPSAASVGMPRTPGAENPPAGVPATASSSATPTATPTGTSTGTATITSDGAGPTQEQPRDPFVVYQLRKPSQRGGAVVPRLRHNPGPSPANYRFARVPPAPSLPAPPLPKSLDYPPRLLDWDDTMSYSSHSTRTSLLSSETAYTRSVNSAFMHFDSPTTDLMHHQTPVHAPVAVRRPFHISSPHSHQSQLHASPNSMQQNVYSSPYYHSSASFDYLADSPASLHARDPYDAALRSPPLSQDYTRLSESAYAAARQQPTLSYPLESHSPSLSLSPTLPHSHAQHHALPYILSKLEQEELIVEKLLSKKQSHSNQPLETMQLPPNQHHQPSAHQAHVSQQQTRDVSQSNRPISRDPALGATRQRQQQRQTPSNRPATQVTASQSASVPQEMTQPKSRVPSQAAASAQQLRQQNAPADYGAAARRRRNLLGWMFSSYNPSSSVQSSNLSRAPAESTQPLSNSRVTARKTAADVRQPRTREQLTNPSRNQQQSRGDIIVSDSARAQQVESVPRSKTPVLSPSPLSGTTASSKKSAQASGVSNLSSSDPSDGVTSSRRRTSKLRDQLSSVSNASKQEMSKRSATHIAAAPNVSMSKSGSKQTRDIVSSAPSSQTMPHTGQLDAPLQARDLSDITVANTSSYSQYSEVDNVHPSRSLHSSMSSTDAHPGLHSGQRHGHASTGRDASRAGATRKSPSYPQKKEPSFAELIEQEKNKRNVPSNSYFHMTAEGASSHMYVTPACLQGDSDLAKSYRRPVDSLPSTDPTRNSLIPSTFESTVPSQLSASRGHVSAMHSDGWRSQQADHASLGVSETGGHGARHRRSLDIHSDWSDPHATDIDVYCQCDCNCVYEEMCRRYCGAGSVRSGTQSLRSGSCASTVPGSLRGSSRRSSGAAPPQRQTPGAATEVVNGHRPAVQPGTSMVGPVLDAQQRTQVQSLAFVDPVSAASRAQHFGIYGSFDNLTSYPPATTQSQMPGIRYSDQRGSNFSSSNPSFGAALLPSRDDGVMAGANFDHGHHAGELGLDRSERESAALYERNLPYEMDKDLAGRSDAGFGISRDQRPGALVPAQIRGSAPRLEPRDCSDGQSRQVSSQRGEWQDGNSHRPARRLSGKALHAVLPRNRSMPSQKSNSRQQRRHSHAHANIGAATKEPASSSNEESSSGTGRQNRGKGRDAQPSSNAADAAAGQHRRTGQTGDRSARQQNRSAPRNARQKPASRDEATDGPRRGQQASRPQNQHKRKKRPHDQYGGGIVGTFRRIFGK